MAELLHDDIFLVNAFKMIPLRLKSILLALVTVQIIQATIHALYCAFCNRLYAALSISKP